MIAIPAMTIIRAALVSTSTPNLVVHNDSGRLVTGDRASSSSPVNSPVTPTISTHQVANRE